MILMCLKRWTYVVGCYVKSVRFRSVCGFVFKSISLIETKPCKGLVEKNCTIAAITSQILFFRRTRWKDMMHNRIVELYSLLRNLADQLQFYSFSSMSLKSENGVLNWHLFVFCGAIWYLLVGEPLTIDLIRPVIVSFLWFRSGTT